MKITNRLGLPDALVAAVQNDPYSKGDADYSVTELLKPPRISVLTERHLDSISEDVSDRIWALMGQVVHGILERSNQTGVAERRLSIPLLGKTVSGAVDRYIDGEIQDYKVVTAYKFKNGVPTEYEEQLNCYAAILQYHDIPVSSLRVIGILRDWSKMEAARDPEYPQTQVVSRLVPLWPHENALHLLSDRVVLHEQARVKLPECTPDEQWARPSKWAVMKKGKDRAVKLYDFPAEAQSHASSDPSLFVEARPGQKVRCLFYCPASKFCSQFNNSKPTKGGVD